MADELDPKLQCEVVTYYSTNAKPEERWTAYCVLPTGEQWLVRFAGTDELSVVNRAKAFWAKEKARWLKLDRTTGIPPPIRTNDRKTTLGDATRGKIWVINHKLEHIKRIPVEELDSYLAKGYVKGRWPK